MKIKNESERVPAIQSLKVAPLLILGSMILAVAMPAGNAIVSKQPAITLTGTVSDSLCGSDHGIKATGDPECTRMCVELGAQYALVVGKKMYVLQGRQSDLERFAGSLARIKGRAVSRDTVIVDQIAGSEAEAAIE